MPVGLEFQVLMVETVSAVFLVKAVMILRFLPMAQFGVSMQRVVQALMGEMGGLEAMRDLAILAGLITILLVLVAVMVEMVVGAAGEGVAVM